MASEAAIATRRAHVISRLGDVLGINIQRAPNVPHAQREFQELHTLEQLLTALESAEPAEAEGSSK